MARDAQYKGNSTGELKFFVPWTAERIARTKDRIDAEIADLRDNVLPAITAEIVTTFETYTELEFEYKTAQEGVVWLRTSVSDINSYGLWVSGLNKLVTARMINDDPVTLQAEYDIFASDYAANRNTRAAYWAREGERYRTQYMVTRAYNEYMAAEKKLTEINVRLSFKTKELNAEFGDTVYARLMIGNAPSGIGTIPVLYSDWESIRPLLVLSLLPKSPAEIADNEASRVAYRSSAAALKSQYDAKKALLVEARKEGLIDEIEQLELEMLAISDQLAVLASNNQTLSDTVTHTVFGSDEEFPLYKFFGEVV